MTDMGKFDLKPIKRASDYYERRKTIRQQAMEHMTNEWQTAAQLGRIAVLNSSAIGNALQALGPDVLEKKPLPSNHGLLYRLPQGEA